MNASLILLLLFCVCFFCLRIIFISFWKCAMPKRYPTFIIIKVLCVALFLFFSFFFSGRFGCFSLVVRFRWPNDGRTSSKINEKWAKKKKTRNVHNIHSKRDRQAERILLFYFLSHLCCQNARKKKRMVNYNHRNWNKMEKKRIAFFGIFFVHHFISLDELKCKRFEVVNAT